MLLGCCHCGPLDSVSSYYPSYNSLSTSNSSDSFDIGTGCFCIGSVSANTWAMDIDYGYVAEQGRNVFCCAQYRKQKRYILRRQPPDPFGTGVCYWYSDERAGTTVSPDPSSACIPSSPYPRAWMAIHGFPNGYYHNFWPNGWAMSAGLNYYANNNPPSFDSLSVLPYAYYDPNGGPNGQARPGHPINCLTPKVLQHWTWFYGPDVPRRWIGTVAGNIVQFPCETNFGTTSNQLIPPTITLTPIAS